HGRLSQQRMLSLLRTGSAQEASAAIVQAALSEGAQDNATALVVRVRGLARSRLEDALVRSRVLPIPPRLKVGDEIDGHVVTALVADTGVHLLYQVRHAPTGALRALKTLHPARASDPRWVQRLQG